MVLTKARLLKHDFPVHGKNLSRFFNLKTRLFLIFRVIFFVSEFSLWVPLWVPPCLVQNQWVILQMGSSSLAWVIDQRAGSCVTLRIFRAIFNLKRSYFSNFRVIRNSLTGCNVRQGRIGHFQGYFSIFGLF